MSKMKLYRTASNILVSAFPEKMEQLFCRVQGEFDEAVAGLDDLWNQLSEFPGAICDAAAVGGFVSIDDDIETAGELTDEYIIIDVADNQDTTDANCNKDLREPVPTCSVYSSSMVHRYCTRRQKSAVSAVRSPSITLNNAHVSRQ